MQNLPEDMEREILSYLLPDLSTAEYQVNIHRCADTHSYAMRYCALFVNGHTLKNKRGEYLSRICKKNGKMRYYITREIEHKQHEMVCDRVVTNYHYDYDSRYVGKNIQNALMILLYG
jgi:hypothetical protein